MKRIIKYDNEKQKINVKKEMYRIYRGISLKTRNIIYRQKWKKLTKENEDKRVYEMMNDKKWIRDWDYRFYHHMQRSRHICWQHLKKERYLKKTMIRILNTKFIEEIKYQRSKRKVQWKKSLTRLNHWRDKWRNVWKKSSQSLKMKS